MNLEELKSHFVDLFYKDKLQVAFVREIKGKRLYLFLPSGKEELISHLAIVSVGKEKFTQHNLEVLQGLLKEKQRLREELKDKYDLRELWEVVLGEVEETSTWELVGLYLGREPTDDEVAAFVRKVAEERVYFQIIGIDYLKVRSKEEVARLLQQREREQERLKFLQEAEKFLESLLSHREQNWPEEVKTFWLNTFKDYILFEDTTEKGKLLKEVLQKHHLADPLKVFEILSRNKLLPEDWFFELEKSQFPKDFTEKEQMECEVLLRSEQFPENRCDLTDLEVFTIDAEETEDFDDAISVEFQHKQTILWVHIAGVSTFVKPYSPLWEGALQRASTLYLPEGIIPMFPFPLSHGKFSLRRGEPRVALSFKFILNESGEVLDFHILPSIIKVKQRYTYEEVDSFMQGSDPFWRRLYELLMFHKKRRYAQGAFAIILPEVNVKVKPNGEISVERLEMTPSRDLIAEAMILTNYHSAKFLAEHEIPALYRAQKEPYQIVEGVETSLYHQILQLKFMAKSEITLEPAYHSGLGLSCYTMVTSPIRRFLDLLVQYQIEASIEGKAPLSKEELQKLLPDVQSNLQRAQYLQTKRKRYFLLKYLAQHMTELTLKGIIMEIQGNKAKIYLPEYNLTGELLGLTRDYYSGQEIMVALEKVNPLQEVLRLRLI